MEWRKQKDEICIYIVRRPGFFGFYISFSCWVVINCLKLEIKPKRFYFHLYNSLSLFVAVYWLFGCATTDESRRNCFSDASDTGKFRNKTIFIARLCNFLAFWKINHHFIESLDYVKKLPSRWYEIAGICNGVVACLAAPSAILSERASGST